MGNSLLTGISGLRTHQEMLSVIGNNLANVDTTSFKASRILFSDLIYQSLREGSSASSGILGSVNPIQAGSGVQVSQIDLDLTQGNLAQTGRSMDVALEGDGYFLLQGPDGPLYSRAGAFGIDQEGTLVDPATGMPVQRYGEIGEPDGINPGYQVNGDGRINVPLGSRIAGKESTSLDVNGQIPRVATATVAHVLSSSGSFLTSGTLATTGTLLNDLDINVTPYTSGDQIRITGTDVDGNSVIERYSVGPTTTIGNVLDEVRASFPGATIDFVDGKFVATANTAGLSSLYIRLDDEVPDSGTGISNFSDIPMVDTVEGTIATSVSFTSSPVYTSRGSSYTMDMNLTKQLDGTWTLTATVDPSVGTMVDGTVTGIRFADDGSLIQVGGTGTGDINLIVDLKEAVADQTVSVSLGDIGTLNGLSQTGDFGSAPLAEADGYSSGVFERVSIDADGMMFGVADNGVRFELAQLAIASFSNPSGLKSVGGNTFTSTLASGTAKVGTALSGGRGTVRAGQLEDSNVDLTVEFTRLIIAQRGFSANAKTITVTDEVLQELTSIIR